MESPEDETKLVMGSIFNLMMEEREVEIGNRSAIDAVEERVRDLKKKNASFCIKVKSLIQSLKAKISLEKAHSMSKDYKIDALCKEIQELSELLERN